MADDTCDRAGTGCAITAEERAAMNARARELRANADGETAVRAAIAAMSPKDRDSAKLDDGSMWPVAFALTELTAAGETKIGALVKKAVREG